jgi:putative ABC transport system permease protein
MTSLLMEIRQALRGLLRAPGYSASVGLTLALGVAAVASVFALINGVLLRPLPYPDAERLVLVRNQNLQGDWNTSVVDLRAIESQGKSFEAVAAMRSMDVIATDGPESRWVDARWVTAGFFDVMGVAPVRGRGFHPGEDRPEAAPVVVLSDAFADRHFGTGHDAVGRTLTLDGVAHTVVGIMPPGVEQLPGMRADAWPAMRLDEPERRGPFLLNTVARLAPGVTLEQAAADLEAISRRLFPLWQQGFQDETAHLSPRPLHSAIVGDSGNFLWIALGAVAVVLLIAIVNVANLVLMRATERLRDLAVRAALGASRLRLARLLITENLLLAAAGGLAGLGLAAFLLQLYRALAPELPRLAEVAIDLRVAAFVAVIVVANGLLLGTVPLLFAGSGKGRLVHQEQGATERGSQHLLRNGLVVLEFALTLPLLIAAGLLINSLMQLQRVDPGFEADHLLTARVRLLETSYPDEMARAAFWERALAELESLPGVVAAGLANGVPPDSPGTFNNFDIVGRPAAQGAEPMSAWTPVMPGFFETLGVRLLEGRTFNAGDTPESPDVVLVSETWAKRYFPGETAVGKQLYEGGDRGEPVTIVGVTSDVKFAGLEQPGDGVFAPISQGWQNNPAYLYLRTGPEPLALAEPVRATLARLEPALIPAEVTTMESRLRDSLGDERHWAVVVVGFALLAVLLSAVGVSGVLAYYVSRQHREIGIRLALGADAGHVLGMVIRRGIGCALAGAALGVVLAFFLTRGLESLLFEVNRTHFPTLVVACALLLVIALVASWVPARRAARVDPMVALRLE